MDEIRQVNNCRSNAARRAWVQTLAAALCLSACTSGEIEANGGPAQGGMSAVGGGSSSGSSPGTAAGSAGTSSSVSTLVNLSGSPQYLRFIRLTNGQWAQSVQD